MRGQLPQLTPAEMQRYHSSLYGMAAIPGVSMGRDRYAAAKPPGGGGVPALKLSPQAREAARRAYSSGECPPNTPSKPTNMQAGLNNERCPGFCR